MCFGDTMLSMSYFSSMVTSVNLVHNAPVELPPARSFPACAPPRPVLAPPARSFPARPPPAGPRHPCWHPLDAWTWTSPVPGPSTVSWVITVTEIEVPKSRNSSTYAAPPPPPLLQSTPQWCLFVCPGSAWKLPEQTDTTVALIYKIKKLIHLELVGWDSCTQTYDMRAYRCILYQYKPS
jgi:hypothetical protein